MEGVKSLTWETGWLGTLADAVKPGRLNGDA